MKMRTRSVLATLLLMVAGLQTAWAQKMIVRTTGSQTAAFNVSKVEGIYFAEEEPIYDVHEWVDLGLPSGTLWATCNIGANKPEEYGDYFAWGETEPKDEYNWSTYKWCNGSSSTIMKYCTQSTYGYNGFTDSKTEFDPMDDAAAVNWGIKWQMPSIDQIKELLNNDYTKTAWTTQNGVRGRLIRSRSNGNRIFLPAAGYYNGSNCKYAGSEGYYWSRSLETSYPYNAYDMDFDYDYIFQNATNRPYGRSVRPVRALIDPNSVLVTSVTLNETLVNLPVGGIYSLTATVQPEDATNKSLIWSSSDTGIATVDQAGNVTALASGICTITCSAADGSNVSVECQVIVMMPGTFGTLDGHGWVNLGLPSGTLWATCNVGASSPEEFGDYFAWGETRSKSEYSWDTYKWCNGSYGSLTKYCTDASYGGGSTDGKTELDPGDDAATVNWGSQWQMPSKEQRNELIDKCTNDFIWVNGNRVARITGPNGNFILLPTALYCDGASLIGYAETAAPEYQYCNGFYWTRSLQMMGSSGGTYKACCISFGIGTPWYLASYGDLERNCGLSVRPVLATQSLNTVKHIVSGEIPVTIKSSDTKRPVAMDFSNDAENKDVVLESSDENEADMQTTSGYKMVVRMTDNQALEFNVSKLEEVIFTEEEPTNDDLHGVTVGHEWIDLGLPSGTLWATCNIGATSPEECGDYFAWGETKSKDYYNETTYFDINDDGRTFKKYNNNGGRTELQPADDAATANWGAPWRMPTSKQMEELCKKCSREMIQQNGVNGILVTGPNGNSIFLPAAGYYEDDWLLSAGSEGDYWTCSLNPNNNFGSYYLFFGSSRWSVSDYYRSHGQSVRAVYCPKLTLSASTVTVYSGAVKTVSIESGLGSYTVSSNNENIATASIDDNIIAITGKDVGEAIITITDTQTHQTAPVKVTVLSLCPDGNHPHAIDLGLPSGTKWSCCNVGANKTEESGNRFAWGETSSKSEYSWDTYKWCYDGRYGMLTKYCTDSSYSNNGFTDGLMELFPEDDAATVNWGNNWQMPSEDQIKEVISSGYTTAEWMTQNGVNGWLITSRKNGNSIFLPAADSYGSYWSRSLNTGSCMYAYGLNFDSNNIYGTYYIYRIDGLNVRPIYVALTLSASSIAMYCGSAKTVSISSGSGHYMVSSSNESIATASIDNNAITIAGKDAGEAIITITDTWTHQTATVEVTVNTIPDAGNHEWVDLGLPSGTLWATCNVGANSPEEYGDYFAWGETEPKDYYYWSTYKWCNGSYKAMTKYCTLSDYGIYGDNGFTDDLTELDPEDDAATMNWGGGWQMPSTDQISELISSEYTTTRWTTQGGVYGCLITSKSNSNTLFLPAAGFRWFDELNYADSTCYYWSRSLYTNISNESYYLKFYSSDFYVFGNSRYYGQSVRPVRVK